MGEEFRLQEQENTCEASMALIAKLKFGKKGLENYQHRQTKNQGERRNQGLICHNCVKINKLVINLL